ncbi:MAG: Asp-tRNA(Asn)/Glu-tRNA(Gln) amidotransferase GatCAB subunit B [Candidatus Marinimicrobia bacterium]|nr:Asp-tRNA(Asn)/Glu-tRNA(Gln) amidotransferase GatCAB subunit B [Candidatus Neomarinimicrobiota bacterium]
MNSNLNWNIVIGLEVHVQLNTNTKLFCGCKNESLGNPNSRCCPICIGLPGALPAPNLSAIKKSILFGIAANSKINSKIQFARKNYFYPDLPKGYQTSQHYFPICENGEIQFFFNKKPKSVRLTRAHLEEDAGKLIHSVKNQATHIDLNRCGSPLLEIVSEPDLRSAEEARAYLAQLKQLIQYLGISNCDMEKGQLRCDANVSIRKNENEKLGTRTEIKNVNSFKFVEKAIKHEVNRQIEILESGREVHQCTLQYDDKSDSISILRIKEDAQDYRYFPCPDLPLVSIESKKIDKIKFSCPETPINKRLRFQKEYQLSFIDSERICQSLDIANYFENLSNRIFNPKEAKNLLLGAIAKILKDKKISINDLPISIEEFSELYQLKSEDKISNLNYKKLIRILADSNHSLTKILEDNNLIIEKDDSIMDDILEVANEHPKELERFRNGEEKLKGFFMGQIMRKTQIKANPKEIIKLIENLKILSD